MFYFKDAGIPPSKMVPEQLGRVQKLKKLIASKYGGLYHEFETVEEFRTKLRMHLSSLVQDWLETSSTVDSGATKMSDAIADTDDPLANLMALTDADYDEGLIDSLDSAGEGFASVAGVIENMTDAARDLGEKIQNRTKEMALVKSLSQKQS